MGFSDGPGRGGAGGEGGRGRPGAAGPGAAGSEQQELQGRKQVRGLDRGGSEPVTASRARAEVGSPMASTLASRPEAGAPTTGHRQPVHRKPAPAER